MKNTFIMTLDYRMLATGRGHGVAQLDDQAEHVQLDDHTHDTTIVIKHQEMIPLTAGSQTDEYKEQHKQQANRKMMQLFEVEDEF